MKILLLITLMILPMLTLAWDGGGYDYKRGRPYNLKERGVYRANDAELDNAGQKMYRDSSIDFFQRLDGSINIEISDPNDFIEIEAIPNYSWID